MAGFEVVVVGGGLIGAAVAYELAQRGRQVAIVERGPVAGEASWASAGIISLPNQPQAAPARVEITRRSLTRFPELVAELEESTGIDIEYRRPGNLLVALGPARAEELNRLGEWQRAQGFDVENLDPASARGLEPGLADGVQAAWFAPGIGALRVTRLTEALVMAASRDGTAIMADNPVSSLIQQRGRVLGVRTSQGDIPAEVVVLAAGAWTGELAASVGLALPVRPVKGQSLALAGAPQPPRHIVSGHGIHLVPRADGTIAVAATEEEAGFDQRVTAEGVTRLTAGAAVLVPSLPQGELASSWSGLRPAAADGEPLMGPVPDLDGLWIASGHFRTGAKEAPESARLVADAILSGEPDPLLQRFLPARFLR